MIYLDNAATTKVHPAVLTAMIPYLTEQYGNPSANYDLGVEAKKAIEHARHIIAKSINADDDEIYFTSGGTEADNTVIKAAIDSKSGILTTPIEHKAIRNSLPLPHRKDNDSFFDVYFLDITKEGRVSMVSLNEASMFNRLVSVMYANNETGVIQPVSYIGNYIYSYADLAGTVLHTDAVQAYCHIPIDVKAEHIDMMSASAHKFHGPKGVGFLYIDKHVDIPPLLDGGGQERGFRSGTENVASIVGMGKAVEIAMMNMSANIAKVLKMKDTFEDIVMNSISGVHINGCEYRLPGHSNITIDGVKAEEALEMLNASQIYASSGSACSAKDSKPSYVLKSMGLTDEQANSSLRFSFGEFNTMDDAENAAKTLKTIVNMLRS